MTFVATENDSSFFRILAEAIPAIVFAAGGDGLVNYVSAQWLRYTGRPPAAAFGTGYLSYIHPNDQAGFVAQWNAIRLAGESGSTDVRLRGRDDSYHWHRVSFTPDRNGTGEIVRWFGAATDIDAQRRAVDALQIIAESGISATETTNVDRMLERIAQAALSGMAELVIFDILDSESSAHRIVMRDPSLPERAETLSENYDAARLRGLHPIARALATRSSIYCSHIDDDYLEANIEPQERRDAWRQAGIRSVISSPLLIGQRLYGTLTLLRTGATAAFEAQDVRIVEEIARRSAVAMENIRLEQAAREAAAERDERFQRIADVMPQLMWIADENGALEWVNQRWLDFCETDLSHALSDGWAAVIHPDDDAEVVAAWRRAREKKDVFECEFRMLRSTNKTRWFLVRAAPVLTTAGLKWYGTNTDIDEARRAARTARVFADVGEALSESLGLQDTLDAVMETVVPEFADWAYLTLFDESGDLYVAAIYHTNVRSTARLTALLGRIYARGNQESGASAILRSREPILFDAQNAEELYRLVEPHVRETMIQEAGIQSGVSIPLIVGSTVRGHLTLVMSSNRRRLSRADLPFFIELSRRIAPAIANAELYERERRVAQSFQEAALPSSLPMAPGYIFSAVYEAGRAEALVGGDWYDAFKLLDGRMVVSIGDVAGSGLRAAVTMANIRQAVRGVAHVHADPELMLEAADRALRSEDRDYFATAFVGVIDPIANTIAYKSAGHPPALLVHADGTIEELRTEGLPLGLRDPDRTPAMTRALRAGSTLLLYTDGLIESTRDVQEGESRLRSAVLESRAVDPERRATALYETVLRDGSRDDVAIMTIAVGTRPECRRWTINARNKDETALVRAQIISALHEHRQSADPSMMAELVLAELVGNLARYAPDQAEAVLEWDGDRAILHIRDQGPGFEFFPKLPTDVFSETGRGLFLISALSEEFNVTRRPEGGSHARVVFPV